MSGIATTLLVLNAMGLGLMLWRGGWPERIAAMLLIAAVLVEPLVIGVTYGTWRIGIASLNLALLIGLGVLAFRAHRWWLIPAVGIQLVIVLTHLLPLLTYSLGTWTGATMRLALWATLSLLFFAAAWEGWAAKRFAQEGGHELNPR